MRTENAPMTITYTAHHANEETHAYPLLGMPSAEPGKPRRRSALFWTIGSSLASAAGFLCIMLYEQYDRNLTELRNDLKHFNEVSGEQVKRDEMRNRFTSMWNIIKDMQTASQETGKETHRLKADILTKETRLAQLEQQLKSADDDRKELNREVLRLRERLASVEGRVSSFSPVIPSTTGK
jgi:septal ring factor EnvC (AmiA/AmiB activator)